MAEANNRFKELRKACQKTQEAFGDILGITREGVASIEAGRRKVTDKHIKFLCIEPINGKYVNEEWLRTGEGNMFIELPEEEETAALVSDLLEAGKNNPFYEIILEIMRTYNELSPKSQEVLRDSSAKLLENLRKKKES